MKKLKNFVLAILILLVLPLMSTAQDAKHAKSIAKTLTSEIFHGRCYTNKGADKAAKYIQKKFEEAGLLTVNGQWMQEFSFDLNQIKKVKLKIDGQVLTPGEDYVIRRNSPSVKGSWSLQIVKPALLKDPDAMQEFINSDIVEQFLVIDLDDLRANRNEYDSAAKILFSSAAKNFILLHEQAIKDYVGYGRKPSERVVINIRKSGIDLAAKTIKLKLKTEFNEITTSNVMAWLPGENKDSVIILCGHYDHLGEMGPKVYFPGADDNASALAAMIEMSNYLNKNDLVPRTNLLFVGFSGEEAGLLGSGYFVKNLPVAKEKISYVVNMDMIGFGNAGLQVWNGKNEPRLVNRLQQINKKYDLLDTLIIRKNTPNSDHYSFTQQEIPAIFLSTGLKPSKYYHTVYDTYENTEFGKFKEIIRLVAKMVLPEQDLSVQK